MLWTDDLDDVERAQWVAGLRNKVTCCQGKVKYSKQSAIKTSEELTLNNKYGKRMDAYLCLWCEHWHVGGSVRWREPRKND